jgi:hypothetical protein
VAGAESKAGNLHGLVGLQVVAQKVSGALQSAVQALDAGNACHLKDVVKVVFLLPYGVMILGEN